MIEERCIDCGFIRHEYIPEDDIFFDDNWSE